MDGHYWVQEARLRSQDMTSHTCRACMSKPRLTKIQNKEGDAHCTCGLHCQQPFTLPACEPERTPRLQESVPQHDALMTVGCGLQMPFFQEINELATLNCTSARDRAADVGSASSAA